MLTRTEIELWLQENDPKKLEILWSQADQIRKQFVGDEIHLRGLIEISSFCSRTCLYCGLRSPNTQISRYRLTLLEILEAAQKAKEFGCGTLVLQSGEDPQLETHWITKMVRNLKNQTQLAITLSLGERPRKDYQAFKEAGADRYFLRFETSDLSLYQKIHPPKPEFHSDRFLILQQLKEIGFEVGSGIMTGLPGQTFSSLIDDLLWFQKMDLDMVGMGPYLPHPDTPLGQDQTIDPNAEILTYKMIALLRLLSPNVNIPSTTALSTLNPEEGNLLGLQRGANVLMPNFTPPLYQSHYEIYPQKGHQNFVSSPFIMLQQLRSLGRFPGKGPGKRKP